MNIIDCNPRTLEFFHFNSKDELNEGYRGLLASAIPEYQPDGRKSVTLDEKIKIAFDKGYCEFDTYLCLMSPNTIQSYRESINLLLDYATAVKGIRLQDMSFSKIDNILLFEFLDWLETERACSISTRNQRLSCIRSFYKYSSGWITH